MIAAGCGVNGGMDDEFSNSRLVAGSWCGHVGCCGGRLRGGLVGCRSPWIFRKVRLATFIAGDRPWDDSRKRISTTCGASTGFEILHDIRFYASGSCCLAFVLVCLVPDNLRWWHLPFVVAAIVIGLITVGLLGRYLGLSRQLSGLIAIGTSICGCTAIVATAPLINAKESEVSYAIACITVFGLAAMFLYPILAYQGVRGRPSAGRSVSRYVDTRDGTGGRVPE